MLKIELPNNFVAERTYIAEVLFSEILGLTYELQFTDRHDCMIAYGNHTLITADAFWTAKKSEYGFLNLRRIPEKVSELPASTLGGPMVAIYGTATCEWNIDNQCVTANCGIDIFASAFFMLTRWEESVITKRDKHGRFPYSSSLAWIHGFHHRPVVNEYAAFIRLFLEKSGFPLPMQRYTAQFISTHDVDYVFKWTKATSWVRTIIGDLFRRRSFALAFSNIGFFLKSPVSKYSDPYNTYKRLIKDDVKTGAKSIFYFLMDENNIKSLNLHGKWLFRKILSNGSIIGLHAGFNSYLPNGQLHKEKLMLESLTGTKVNETRQHYLRFSVPETWNMQNKRGIAVDSSLYYPEAPGFRTGCCTEFSCFDIFHRTKLPIRERTLCFMDRSMFYPEWQENGAEHYIMDLVHQVEKHGGDFVMLWHNSSFDYSVWKDYIPVYESIIAYFAKKQQQK